MTFWINQVLEPKRAFRFVVRFKGMPGGASWYATKASKPQLELSEVEHKYLNHNFYYPGRSTWSPVTITMVDPGEKDADAAFGLHKMLADSGYLIPGRTGGGDIEIVQLDADGNDTPDKVLEMWTLKNAWVKKIAPSELSYDSEELSTIEVEIRFDWAELKTSGQSPVHKPTIRTPGGTNGPIDV